MSEPAAVPRAFQVLVKPTGSACNLRCDYCFFLEKGRLYPEVAPAEMRMTDAVQDAFLRQYIAASPIPDVNVTWQGGEPTLMGLDFFRRAVASARRHAADGTRLSFSIQTNGILLDEAWCSFFRENDVLVGLSLDGPRELHDAYRHDAGGRPTFARVARAAALLRTHGVDFNVLCTVHAANAGHPLEVYRFFRDELEVEWIQFIPIVERVNADGTCLLQEGDTVTRRSVDPDKWGEFLLIIFAEWVTRDVTKVHVNVFESAFAAWVGAPALMCVFAETCGDALAIEYNGDLYSCDHFVEPACLLGNVMSEPLAALVESEQQRRFGAAKRDELPAYCRSCDVLFACHGECPKNRFATTPDGEAGLNYLCRGYRAFFRRIDGPMRVMAELYRTGRSPAEVMDQIATARTAMQQAFARAGRNDPCPCGSGRRFRVCHGR